LTLVHSNHSYSAVIILQGGLENVRQQRKPRLYYSLQESYTKRTQKDNETKTQTKPKDTKSIRQRKRNGLVKGKK